MASKYPSKTPVKDWLIVHVAYWLVRLTGLTSKTIRLGEEPLPSFQGNYILATWHQNIYFGCWIWQNQKMGAMISQSRDGDLIARLMERFDFIPIRGSSSKGGMRVLREVVKFLKGTHPATISPDGPKGPKHKVQPGVIMVAKMTGMPIVPWDYEAVNQWVSKKSWDNHKIPKPFTMAVSSMGAPFYVPSEISREELEDYCKKLEQAMQDNQRQVSERVAQLKQAGADRFWGKIGLMWKAK